MAAGPGGQSLFRHGTRGTIADHEGHKRVKLTLERLPESRVQLEITADEPETAAAMKRAVRKVGNQITLPGFRKGKAPQAMMNGPTGPTSSKRKPIGT